MNKIKTFLTAITLVCITALHANASVDSVIQKSNLTKNSEVAISVKDVKTGKVIFQKNEHKLMNPASVQKVFTMRSAYEQLGRDYTFKTTAYTDKNGNLYIKLGADPSLNSDALKNLMTAVKAKQTKPFKDVIVDPSIIDNKQWGIGWMWDDDANHHLPKYGAYTVNSNKIDIAIESGKNGKRPEIKNKSGYSMAIINYLQPGNSNKIEFERQPWITSDTTIVKGTISSPLKTKLTVDDIQRHFYSVLSKSMNDAKVKYTGTIKTAPTPAGLSKIAEHNSFMLSELIAHTLKNSDNLYSELIFKVAASEYTRKQGTTEDAVSMFNKYYSNIKSDKPVVVDGCGISRNDLMSADWATEALNKIYKDKYIEEYITLLPKPIEGTLSDRLLDISLKLRAKTGTASGISSIAGYIDTKSGKKYSFAIFIQNFTEPVINVKKFEDDIIHEIYKL